jgi:hypothetical protein
VAALTGAACRSTRIQDVGEAVESEHARERAALPAAGIRCGPISVCPSKPAAFSTMERGRPLIRS